MKESLRIALKEYCKKNFNHLLDPSECCNYKCEFANMISYDCNFAKYPKDWEIKEKPIINTNNFTKEQIQEMCDNYNKQGSGKIEIVESKKEPKNWQTELSKHEPSEESTLKGKHAHFMVGF